MVRSLVPLETDPHSFEPTPSDLRDVAAADLLIVNGGGLEGSLLDTLENAGGDATVVDASAGLAGRTPQPGEPTLEDGGVDPHFWLDPVLAKTYVANIRDAFAAADPAGAAEYEANAAAYQRQLDELDAWITAQVAEIPEAGRRLVMNHDQPRLLRGQVRPADRRHGPARREHGRDPDGAYALRPRQGDRVQRSAGRLRRDR